MSVRKLAKAADLPEEHLSASLGAQRPFTVEEIGAIGSVVELPTLLGMQDPGVSAE